MLCSSSCVALRCVVLRSAECCVVRLCCVALCGDLLFVVSSGCVPVVLRCVVLHCVAICCVFCGPLVLRCVALRCVALCCCYAYVVFSSLSLRCVFPVVLRFLSCLLSLVFCWSPLS